MIDTIRLNLYDVIVKSNNNLITKKESFNTKDSSFDLYIDENGVINQGVSAYINNKYYNLSIRPKYNINLFKEFKAKIYKRDFVKDSKSDFIWERDLLKQFVHSEFKDNKNCNFILQTSLSKLYSYLKGSNQKNLEYLNGNQIKESFNFLFELLINDGLLANLDDANLIRLDLFVNLQTEYNFQAYKNFLRTIQLSRKEKSERQNSFLFSNKQNQLSIYDKRKELELSKIYLENEIIRFENRFLTKNKIKKTFGNNISDIILNRKPQLNEMKKIYNDIFNGSEESIIIDRNLEAIISKSNSIRNLKQSVFYYMLSNNYNETIEETINKHYKKTQSWKIRNEIKNFTKEYGKMNNFNLVNELKSKYEEEINFLEKY